MTKKLLYVTAVAALAIVAVVAFALPASAEQRTFEVQLSDGSLITVTVQAACVPMNQVPGLPGTPVHDLTPPGVCGPDTGGGTPTTPQSPPPSTPPPTNPSGGKNPPPNANGGGTKNPSGHPSSGGGHSQSHSGSRRPAHHPASSSNPQAQHQTQSKKHPHKPATHHSNGVPTPSNPTFFDALPGPGVTSGVPNFVIQKFKVPIFLLPIYQAAGIQYGVRWEVLAGINEIETDYGRNLNVSSAGAVGWMQFMPATWKTWGVDANNDGKADPYNPVDAIFSAARYLKAAGAQTNIRRAIFAYNHASWYVDSVMLRARLIAGYPPDFVGSLTGLTEGRFPVGARAKYADDAAALATKARIKAGQNAARVIGSSATRTGIDIYSTDGAPVIATNDGIVRKVGYSKAAGRYIVLQDVYGNRYTYSQLGSVQRMYPVPKQDVKPGSGAAQVIAAHKAKSTKDPKPTLAASAGSHSLSASSPSTSAPAKQRVSAKPATRPAPAAAPPSITYKARLFAHPQRPNSRRSGGLDQVFASQTGDSQFTTYDNFFSGKVGLNSSNSKLQPLKAGSQVIAGTVLGHIGKTDPKKAPHVYFEIQPAGKGAPKIDPKPILDGWKLLESTAVYRANGKNALYGQSSTFSIGQVLLMPKSLLQKRVLADPRVTIYPGGRNDIRTGQIDRRVLATIEYLAESGLDPTISCLKSGHSMLTTAGNVSEHTSGNAVDIAKVNGIPILGHQDPGGITEVTVRRLMLLQGTMAPHQIISLLDLGGNTMALADHNDHIHVGFRPLFGNNAKLGAETAAILKPGQWENLVQRLKTLPNPVVPTTPSKYALPVKPGQRGNGD